MVSSTCAPVSAARRRGPTAATAAASEEERGAAGEEEEGFLFNLRDAEKIFLDKERAAMDMVIKPAANAHDSGGCVTEDGNENGREEGSAVLIDCNQSN